MKKLLFLFSLSLLVTVATAQRNPIQWLSNIPRMLNDSAYIQMNLRNSSTTKDTTWRVTLDSLAAYVLRANGGGSSGWSLTGNASTNPATDFMGSTDSVDFVLRTNNNEKMRMAAAGICTMQGNGVTYFSGDPVNDVYTLGNPAKFQLGILNNNNMFKINDAANPTQGIFFYGTGAGGFAGGDGLAIDITSGYYGLGNNTSNIIASPVSVVIQAATTAQLSLDATKLTLQGNNIINIGGKDIDYSAANAAGVWVNDGAGVISYAPFIGKTYIPTLTNTTNVTSSTPQRCTYTRIDSVVTVSGFVGVVTTLAVATVLEISLPIASDLANVEDLNGVANASSAIATNGYSEAEVTNNTAALKFIGLSVGGSGNMYFTFSYVVK